MGAVPDQTFKDALAVGLGAGLGALTRFAVTSAVPAGSVSVQVATTLIINIIGCFAMGAYKPGLMMGVGFLGGFTTFSAMAVAAVQSSAAGALVIVGLSFLGCVCAWLAGDRLVARGRRGA